jgi:hypothetical protein
VSFDAPLQVFDHQNTAAYAQSAIPGMAPPRSSSEDQAFTMDFHFDVTELDLAEKVEAVAKQSALGHFRRARVMFDDALKKQMAIFLIYSEYLRLLYDQGDFETLSKAEYSATQWTSFEQTLVKVCCGYGKLLVGSCSDEKAAPIFEHGLDLKRMLHSTDWHNYSEEQVCALVRAELRHVAELITDDGSRPSPGYCLLYTFGMAQDVRRTVRFAPVTTF